MEKQKTIVRESSIKGIGLHTADEVTVVFKPAEVNSGITLVRIDLPDKPVIKVGVNSLLSNDSCPRRSSLGRNGAEVHTIEHLMACLVGLGIDNIYVEIDGSEFPGMDGSGLNYLEALSLAGIKEQEAERQYYSIKEPICIEEGNASLIALPCPEYKISYTLDYNHPFLKSGFCEVILTPQAFKQDIAPARTFCLEEEAQELQKQGLGKGANYNNTLVVGKNGVIKNKLRFLDEFTRHKMLDLIGDLYILGKPLKAHIIALRSGHSLNLKLVKKIIQQAERNSSAGIAGAGAYSGNKTELSVEEIKEILPHREPFLFVDRIISLEKGRRVVGIKNVTINDYFFKGHFPQKPVMPGVIIVEALAQVGGVMMLSPEENRGKIAYFMAINNVKFRRPVVPGDQLVLEIEAGKIKSRTGQVFGKASVDGKVVAEAELMFALVNS